MRNFQRYAGFCAALIFWLRNLVFLPGALAAQDNSWDKIDLGGLPEIRSSEGILDATLVAENGIVQIGGSSFLGAIYNGNYGGPVLRVRPGDIVRIRLINHTSEPTNIHFHGLRVSPLGHGDNMHTFALPTREAHYNFRVPLSHPPGLFWYHDHIHKMAEAHVMAGLSGTFLVDGFARQFSNLHVAAEKLISLKDYSPPSCATQHVKVDDHCRVLSLNGQVNWVDSMQPGETQLWRVANQGANLTLHLQLPGFSFRIIGRDGLPTTAAEDASSLDIMPASRIDVLVTAIRPGNWPLTASNVLTGEGDTLRTTRTLGTVSVAGPLASPVAPPVFPEQRDLRRDHIDASRVVDFTEDQDRGRYFINGKMFDAERIDLRIPLGHTEVWTVRNRTQDFHEFHIHQIGFQLIEINGKDQPFTGFIDDVMVPEMGEVKLILPFIDPTILGHFMYHCHVLKHEDGGMMANIEVYRPGSAMATPICRSPELATRVTR